MQPLRCRFRTASVLLLLLTAWAEADDSRPHRNSPDVPTEADAMTPSATDLIDPWTGPFGGVPPWHRVQVDAFRDAFDQAIGQADAEIEAIAQNPQPPTFANTILALDRAGETLRRLETLFDVHSANLNLGPIPDIERAVSPKLAAHADSITQNEALFARIEAVHSQVFQDRSVELLDDARRLLDETYKEFVRRGARLGADDKAKLGQINQRLARLFTDFNQNVLEEEKRHTTWIDSTEQLSGLPASMIESMREAAKEKGGKAEYAVTNTRSSMDPFLTYADDRQLRQQVWQNYYFRCDHDDTFDNKAIIGEILGLRAARAKLLGYPTHAHWRMESTMAATPDAAMKLMMDVWPHAVARVRQEVADMQRIADREADAAGTPRIQIQPWDYRYYAEKVRHEKFDLDMTLVRPYLQLDKLRDAMMWCARELFGLEFRAIDGVPTFHPDVTVYEVTDEAGEHVGLFYLDPFARDGKRSGAWMTDYREQAGWSGSRQAAPASEDVDISVPTSSPIVSNNSNFIPGADDRPVCISWDDAVTLFHEFGHALHGLSSRVRFRSQSGTNVARDFVEFPSQLMEHWLETESVLQRFATHSETGEPMPAELLEKLRRSGKFNSGFETVEYLACAILDMQLHQRGESVTDLAAFEKQSLAEIGMPEEIPMRHRLPHFSHLFSSDSYSAGYYSYLWSDALTADAAEMFENAPDGFFDEEVATRLFGHVLSVGDTVDPAETYRAFRGRDVDTQALLRKRGFAE